MSRLSTRDYLRWLAELAAITVAFGLLLATPLSRAAGLAPAEPPAAPIDAVSYTHLTLPTNREV